MQRGRGGSLTGSELSCRPVITRSLNGQPGWREEPHQGASTRNALSLSQSQDHKGSRGKGEITCGDPGPHHTEQEQLGNVFKDFKTKRNYVSCLILYLNKASRGQDGGKGLFSHVSLRG